MKALIDGDVIRYRIGFACQKNVFFVYPKGAEDYGYMASFAGKKALNEWMTTHKAQDDTTVVETLVVDDLANCLHSVKVQLTSILEEVKADDYVIYLSGKDNFRDSLVDYYKANRDRSTRPEHYHNITTYLLEHWKTEVVDGIEADDALGITQDKNTIICSIDKDLDNVPGWHYNFATGAKYYVEELDALRNFYSQMITGDPGDNIPGLYKVTGKRATAKLQEPILYMEDEKEMWEYVHSLYAKTFYNMDKDTQFSKQEIDDATTIKLREIGKLLWIHHEVGDDWEPPV